MSDFESRLRDSLARQAGRAPDGDRLAEQIIAAAQEPTPLRRGHDWRKWTFPALAAAAVAAVALTVAGISQFGPSASGPAGHHPTGHSNSVHSTLPTPDTTTSPLPSVQQSRTPSSTGLTNVHIVDATFTGTKDGWLLARADSTTGGSGPATAMLRTIDGGVSWQSMTGPAADVPGVDGCAAPCVEHIRFATAQYGYAYGPTALFITTDGGSSWQRQKGGALFLETLDNNVIRVTATHASGCPGPCGVGVETSAIGSTHWTPATLPGEPTGSSGLQFSRGGSDAYLLFTGDPAGGAGAATSTLYRSSNDGLSWSADGEPCSQTGGEVDSRTVVAAPLGRAAVLCVPRQQPSSGYLATSTDNGAHFSAQPGRIPLGSTDLLVGDPHTVLLATGLVGGSDSGAVLSRNGGQSWQSLRQFPKPVLFAGWENSTVGRIVPVGGQSIWTTHNAGRTWTQFRFG